MPFKISLIIPVFNEEQSIPLFYERVRNYAPLKNFKIELFFINDGSSDRTEAEIKKLQVQDSLVRLYSLPKNKGKEIALLMGLKYAECDALIPIDVDLQDPIELISEFIQKWQEGVDIVLGKRLTRRGDSFIKCFSAAGFYFIYNLLCRPKITPNVGDFRLLSSHLIPDILKYCKHTSRLLMKAEMSHAVGKTAIIHYHRPARATGDAQQSPAKLIRLACNAIITYFSPFQALRLLSILMLIAILTRYSLKKYLSTSHF